MRAICQLTCKRLISGAHDPEANLSHAFAGVLARFGTLGLAPDEQKRLLARYFPGAAGLIGPLPDARTEHDTRADEYADLLELLLAHRTGDSEETTWLAHAVAIACLGDNHLWQDMGLPNRDSLSDLLHRHFTALFERNTGNMKWKKFFYKQLCERAEVNLCKAPSCAVCTDYAKCFGPE